MADTSLYIRTYVRGISVAFVWPLDHSRHPLYEGRSPLGQGSSGVGHGCETNGGEDESAAVCVCMCEQSQTIWNY